MNYNKLNIDKKIQRSLAIEAGFYDGRYKTKIFVDRKKQTNKYFCRLNKINAPMAQRLQHLTCNQA